VLREQLRGPGVNSFLSKKNINLFSIKKYCTVYGKSAANVLFFKSLFYNFQNIIITLHFFFAAI
jgi:hypothetical protein